MPSTKKRKPTPTPATARAGWPQQPPASAIKALIAAEQQQPMKPRHPAPRPRAAAETPPSPARAPKR
jgi:hypothetical protein